MSRVGSHMRQCRRAFGGGEVRPCAPPLRSAPSPVPQQAGRIAQRVLVQPARAAASEKGSSAFYNMMSKVVKVQEAVNQNPALASCSLTPVRVQGDVQERIGFMAKGDIADAGVVLTIPENLAVTSADAEDHDLVGPIAADCSELIAMTLWLVAEKAKGAESSSASLIATLPDTTYTPLLWEDKELAELLRGSAVLVEARARVAELKKQWDMLEEKFFSQDRSFFKPEVFNYSAFAQAFAVVMAHAVYLPSAECFALLPVASLMGRTGNENGCMIDYDDETKSVVVRTTRAFREGQEVLLYDPRPNNEMLLATGTVQENNSSNFVLFSAGLLEADRYFMMKNEILTSMGLEPKQEFPVYADRMPNQLLAYLRLSRIADPALFAKVSFEQDIVLSQMNEYEVLQLLMGDCRERLAEFSTNVEDDIKLAQDKTLDPKLRLACKMRLSEKRLISSTMDAVRRRLAPIRGIPTKQGFEDQNSDLVEIFDALESIPNAPKALIDGFMSWASGKDDPDWGKPSKPDNKPPRPW